MAEKLSRMEAVKDGQAQARAIKRSFLRWREIPSGVWALGIVSLLMDVSSEMIHALLPLYLVTVLGTSVLTVGVGCAAAG